MGTKGPWYKMHFPDTRDLPFHLRKEVKAMDEVEQVIHLDTPGDDGVVNSLCMISKGSDMNGRTLLESHIISTRLTEDSIFLLAFGIDITFDRNLCLRYVNFHSLGFDQRNGFPFQRTCEKKFICSNRCFEDRRDEDERIHSDHGGHFHLHPILFAMSIDIGKGRVEKRNAKTDCSPTFHPMCPPPGRPVPQVSGRGDTRCDIGARIFL